MIDFADPVAVQAALDASPFQRVLGLRLRSVDVGAGVIVLDMPFHAGLRRQEGNEQVHGGVIASVLDVAGVYALALKLGHFPPTVDLRTDYLRPAIGGLRAEAKVVRCGRTLGVADIALQDSAGKLVAVGRGTYMTKAA